MRHTAFALVVVISVLAGPCLADGRAFPPDNCSEQTPFMAFTAIEGSNTFCNSGQDIFRNALPGCQAGQQVVYDGANFVCQTTTIITPVACGAGEVVTSTGSGFACVPKDDFATTTDANTINGSPHGFQKFSTAGNYTFTVPASVTSVKVIIAGAGAGPMSWGVVGGLGAKAIAYITGLTPGTNIPVTIGAPGANSPATSGGASSFGSYIIAGGGNTGKTGNHVYGELTSAPGVTVRPYYYRPDPSQMVGWPSSFVNDPNWRWTIVGLPLEEAVNYGMGGDGGEGYPSGGFLSVEW